MGVKPGKYSQLKVILGLPHGFGHFVSLRLTMILNKPSQAHAQMTVLGREFYAPRTKKCHHYESRHGNLNSKCDYV